MNVSAAQRGVRLEYLSIGWNSLEALIAVAIGLSAGSIALFGFGLDSAIEVFSSGVLLWRLKMPPERAEQAERIAIRLVGATFLALAAYVTFEAVETLLIRDAPRRSTLGIVLAAASLIVMPLLARAKRKVARSLASDAMNADARQADFCAYLSAILLAGLALNAWLHWWWADPVAALVMVSFIAAEGVRGLRGRACCEAVCQPAPKTTT